MSNSIKEISIYNDFFNFLIFMDLRMKDSMQEEDAGLSIVQISVLRILAIEGEISLIQVAKKAGKDKSQITRVIQDLVKKGLLRKDRSDIDRRSFILKLNPKVQDKVSYYMKKEKELITEMLSTLSKKDKQRFNDIFVTIYKNMGITRSERL